MFRHPVRPLSARNASCMESLESRVMFARVFGIDVSQFQGTIDWNEIASNDIRFVFMRGSRTNLAKDPTFERNLAGATAAGLLVGTYHFTLPNNLNEAGPLIDPVEDARKFVNAAGAAMQTGNLRPVIDSEAGSSLGKEQLSQWILNFSGEVERLTGVRPIVYANINYTVNFLNEEVAAKHDLWLARYNGGNDPSTVDRETSQPDLATFHPNPYGSWNVPYGGPRSDDSWDFWQYTSRGDGPSFGVQSTFLDLDLFNGTYEQLQERFMIGYQKNYPEGTTPFAVDPNLTTIIEAENYDIGGDGVSYADTTPKENTGGIFRTSVREGVDLMPIGGNVNNLRVADAQPGEFVEYTFNASQDDKYQLSFLMSQTESGGTFHAEIDGVPLSTLAVPDTDSVDTFAAVNQNVELTAGKHVVRVSFDTAAEANGVVANLDRIEITEAPPPVVAPPPPPPPPQPEGLVGQAATVRGGLYAAQNFAKLSELAVQRGKGAANTQYTFLNFDLAGTTSITSGKLRLFGRLSDDAVSSLSINVYSVNKAKPFDEDLVTFKKKPAAKKLRASFDVTGTTDQRYEVDLTAFLQSELAAGRTNVTIGLRGMTKADTMAVFASDDSGNENAPSLIIT